jgi:hypothetical protein
MITARNEKIGILRGQCLNEVLLPLDRIKAGEQLLRRFGATDGSRPILNKIITAFEMNVDPQVSDRARKLKIALAKAHNLRREAAEVELEDQPIVAGTSTSQISKPLTLTWHGLMQIQEEQLGDSWRFPDKEFSQEDQISLLEAVLESRPTVGAVQSLLFDIRKPNSDGWKLSMSFGLIVKFAEKYLRQHGVEPTPEDNTAAMKFLAELDAELAK